MVDALRQWPTGQSHERGGPVDPVAVAVAEFGRSVADKLGRGGSAEDQLRGPVELLLKRLGVAVGLVTVPYGEVSLKDLRARPDYAVDVGNARVGYIELKAPGRGIPPDWRHPSKRERGQFDKLRALPNVIYTDGLFWGHYRYGVRDRDLRLGGSLTDHRRPLHPIDHEFEQLIHDFLLWEPERPRSLADLIKTTARQCRLLRDEVEATLAGPLDRPGHEDLKLLADDWRRLLFPDLDDAGFADAYAQTVTFSMLLARVNGIEFSKTSLREIAKQLGKQHMLMGKAFDLLIESELADELRMIDTLRRVIGAVDWSVLDDGRTDIYAELYERFLTEYDPLLRRQSGSYYTPQLVARAMVNFVDEILRVQLNCSWGFASDHVVALDPAMGTGTFLVEIVRSVANTIDKTQGLGARSDRLRALFRDRLVGFEIQAAPYAVAELRLHQVLRTTFDTEIPSQDVRFLTDALADPTGMQERLTAPHKIVRQHRDRADQIKRNVPVMVVIGNPPHVENVKGRSHWIAWRRDARLQPVSVQAQPSLDEFRVPGLGRYESDLHGYPWYYWRWALWKAFEAHPEETTGVIAFITPISFATGTAFAGMREYLRRTCDEGWIIDVSPEGNRSNTKTRVFGAKVQRRLCIAIFARYGQAARGRPARVYRLSLLGTGDQKIHQLLAVAPTSLGWRLCQDAWQGPFLPMPDAAWEEYIRLGDLMPWRSRGVTTGRRWVYAPSPAVLLRRWQRLVDASTTDRRRLLHEGRDRKLDTRVPPLPGFRPHDRSLAEETGVCPSPVLIAFRSFDRQWVIPDNRLMEVPRPPLWAVRSERQVYVSEQDAHPITRGPALVFTPLIPDLHHFNGWGGGGVRPFLRDRDGNEVNLAAGLAPYLSQRLGVPLTSDDVLAYIAAVVAHPGYTERFRDELAQPGVRVPLSAIPDLWVEAVSAGRHILWLHTFGERYADETAGRPQGPLALAELSEIKIATPIRTALKPIPDSISYDEASATLLVGDGKIGPVAKQVWDYTVGGMRVVSHWFDYRCVNPRHMRRSSPLDDINLTRWSADLTDDLLALLAVLSGCVSMEGQQGELLTGACTGDLISTSDLTRAGILPVLEFATKPPRTRDVGTTLMLDL